MFKFRTLNNDPDFLPVRSTRYAGAYDIKAAEDVVLKPYEPVWVSTGLWITEYLEQVKQIPEEWTFNYDTHGEYYSIPSKFKQESLSFFLRIYPRSSFFKKQIYYHPGIIDQDFRDEIKIGIEWRPNPIGITATEYLGGQFPPEIKAKERIAQMQAHLFYTIDGALEQGNERQGGFGSTGV